MKKIAVIIRDRESEALRMAIGLSILHKVDIYILAKKINLTDEVMMNIEMLKELKLCLYTDNLSCYEQIKQINNNIELLTIEGIAKNLLKYDNILPY
jgi:predicted DNA-binding protein with PD1-like motif